jgi:hypothetical protein
VGPVVTGLLVRSYEEGQVPEFCHVRVQRGYWRNVGAVREIAAINSRLAPLPVGSGGVELSYQIAHIRDEDEFLYELTQLSLTTTGAESAMLHCPERRSGAVVTRCIVGPMSRERLGHPLAQDDLLLRAARLGRPVLGPPYGPTEDALALRFASSRGGAGAVAMIPIATTGANPILLELSRPGHSFRRSDLLRAERVVQSALRLRKN